MTNSKMNNEFNDESIRKAIEEWKIDKEACERKYGPMSEWCVSGVRDMSELFYNMMNFFEDISGWDTSNVSDMSYMFYNCKMFNHDISRWNTSNVMDMKFMFGGCDIFDCDLNNWDISNVKDMSNMFSYCEKFHKKNVNSWKILNENNLCGTFTGGICTKNMFYV